MASNLPRINKPPVVANDPTVRSTSSKSLPADIALSKPPAINRTPDVVVKISNPTLQTNQGITTLKGPQPINPKDDPYIAQVTKNPPKPSVRQQDVRDDKNLGLYNPYKDLNTVQGWNTAFKTHGVGQNKSSPYYAAAYQGQTIHDANGNFMLNQNLGNEVTKGYTKYKLASQDNVDGKTVYTYIKSGNV